ncbi:MAG: peptidylprolyl isomerase [Bacteroidia bacterium]|nr:peptidylprolyl isomerase [Bacteroidia bacterium]MBT8277028.1 peptidylprolyl isomerase [Bacteroidia bacterium]NNF31913.1 peptidylprolyl isomerase [Flavobacteriaceae bacterium]NNK53601.1 peptidylprolyl isomerase [Flavobacteriaceae bacterium]NNM08898.1 peptidylprolyl isomerase [Flavobacteriaceae bacterium]
MKRYLVLFFILAFSFGQGFSQKKNDVLLTIDDEPVLASEFIRVYKKNLDLVKDESQKSVEGYLDLFIDYKLKIAEAYDQKYHERQTYKDEFAKYEEQLSRNYIYDNKLAEDLIKEAYDRGRDEIEARHILISVEYSDTAQDTLKAYNEIKSIRERAIAGEDFTELAKEYSTEPGASERGGYLGYFTVFSMVYPFETAAYNTPVGEISEIVRTQFGYHIVKVINRRKKGPEISVSHIMVSDRDDDSRTFDPEERINEIYKMLNQGEGFEKLAGQYSDDKNSAMRGGKLNKFSKGTLRSQIFESYAFGLSNPGDLTKPFKSEFGWHIVRLDKIHNKSTFEELQPQLEKQIKQGARSKVVTSAISAKIKDKYGFSEGEPYQKYFEEYLPPEVFARKYKYDSMPPVVNKTIFTVGDKKFTFEDFAQYIERKQKRIKPGIKMGPLVNNMYREFEVDALKSYFREKLELQNEDYAATINEYRSGLLIFDLMTENIWRKAKTDSLGLNDFYNTVKEKYKWDKRITGTIVSATSEEYAERARNMLNKGKTGEEIKEALNEAELVNVIITSGTFEVQDRQLPQGFKVEKGVSNIYNNDGSYVVINIAEIIPPGIKKLDEVRGKVLNDYQTHLETEWMKSLRNKFTVNVNKKVLKKINKEFKS